MSIPRIAMSTPRIAMSTSKIAMSTPRIAMYTPKIAMSTPRTTHPVIVSDNDCFTTIPHPPTGAGPVFPGPSRIGSSS